MHRFYAVALMVALFFISTSSYTKELELQAVKHSENELCANQNFNVFLKSFSENEEIQANSTSLKLKKLSLDLDVSPEPQQVIRTLRSDELKFPIFPSLAVRKNNHQEMEINYIFPNRAGVSIIQGEIDSLVKYIFHKNKCWKLESIEDRTLTIPTKDILVIKHDSVRANKCLRQADLLEGIASKENRRDVVLLSDRALYAYICAARAGSATGAFSAVKLGTSGQSRNLSRRFQEYLLQQAALENRDALIALSDFYCNKNDSMSDACRDPEKSLEMLIEAAKLGAKSAANLLGAAFERGEFGQSDDSRAIACYRLASKNGDERAKNNLGRLLAKSMSFNADKKCF